MRARNARMRVLGRMSANKEFRMRYQRVRWYYEDDGNDDEQGDDGEGKKGRKKPDRTGKDSSPYLYLSAGH